MTEETLIMPKIKYLQRIYHVDQQHFINLIAFDIENKLYQEISNYVLILSDYLELKS